MLHFSTQKTYSPQPSSCGLRQRSQLRMISFPPEIYLTSERRVVSGIMTRCNQAQKIVFRLLTPIVEQRLELCRLSDTKERPVCDRQSSLVECSREQMDCVEWLIDTSPRKKPWTVVRTVHEIMAVWFGSMFELSMVCWFLVEHRLQCLLMWPNLKVRELCSSRSLFAPRICQATSGRA